MSASDMRDRKDQEIQRLDEISKTLPPDLATLFNAIRMEFDAKLSYSLSRMTNKILMLGVPLGAVGGLVAEFLKPGVTHSAVEAVVRLF